MRLGILPEQGGSIANLAKTGQDTRFINQYLKLYVREFEEVHYCSYAAESLDEPVAGNFHLHPNPGIHRWFYAFLMPVAQRSALRRCSILRVMQATGAIPANLARKLYGVPYVITYGYHYSTELRSEGHRFRAWLFDRRARWAVRSADGIIVTTPALAEFVRACAPDERIALIPNSVDTDLFSPRPTGEAVPRERKRFIAVGNMTANKNQRLILDAVAQLERNDVDVVIIGRGAEEEALRKHAAELGIRLELPGIVPNEELPQWLQRSDAYLITSTSEGHPKSLLEAMSVGLPCIGTDVRGIRDVLEDGKTGWLCALEPESAASAIREALTENDDSMRRAENARRFVLDHYSAKVIMAREVEFLKRIADKK